jgi:hypothetical protein
MKCTTVILSYNISLKNVLLQQVKDWTHSLRQGTVFQGILIGIGVRYECRIIIVLIGIFSKSYFKVR